MHPSPYRGRFAPSPTGPLHAGSLLAALASFLDAKSHSGQWLLRIEDVDQLRVVPDAESRIKRALEAHALHWDAETERQSLRTHRYHEVLELLVKHNHLFACRCTRKQINALGGIYPGTCRSQRARQPDIAPQEPDFSLRFDTSTSHVPAFKDRLQGDVTFDAGLRGDFIVRRRDGLIAYQLAVVVDDFDQGITDVVRGFDIIDSTPWQQALQEASGFPTPRYLHVPILTHGGNKLSKQTGAKDLLDGNPGQEHRNLVTALRQLGQALPEDVEDLDCGELIDYAVKQWDVTRIPKKQQLQVYTVT